MDLGIVDRDGEIVLHRPMQAAPAPCLTAIAPDREALVGWVAGLFTWDWRAALWAQAGMPVVLGHALDMQAIHGGTATHATLDSQQMAVVRRGGMLPQAYVSPAHRRAPRALLRRRMDRTRKRAERLAHLQHTNRPDTLPELGTKRADHATRAGVAERCPAPAVQQRMAVDLARLGSDAPRRNALAWHMVQAAKPPDAKPLDLRHTGPGLGNILRLVRLDASHDLQPCPSGQAVVADGRLGTGAQASAGKRHGTAGATRGHASLQGAFSDAAVLLLRDHPAGQQSRTRFENTHGPGHALTLRAQQRGRAVSDR
jgi:hypothetical protein